jgi:hypothetical protein
MASTRLRFRSFYFSKAAAASPQTNPAESSAADPAAIWAPRFKAIWHTLNSRSAISRISDLVVVPLATKAIAFLLPPPLTPSGVVPPRLLAIGGSVVVAHVRVGAHDRHVVRAHPLTFRGPSPDGPLGWKHKGEHSHGGRAAQPVSRSRSAVTGSGVVASASRTPDRSAAPRGVRGGS